jgi:hypothetical protein
MFGEYSSCIDANTQPTSYDTYTYEAYGYNSFCARSTLGSVVVPAELMSRCYPYVCNTDNIVFTIGTYSITCLSTEAGVQKTLSALYGYLTCPSFTAFCTMSRKTCPNFCNQNGYCMQGICNCYTGYSGADCLQTSCTAGQYYNPVTSTCGANCNPGYYTNPYSRSCELCHSPCSECSGSPTNCVGCQVVNGLTQYFYNGACYAACPASTYDMGGANCGACDTTITSQCFNCTGSPTTCTSCQAGLYLSQPVSGSCVAGCGGGYPLQDEVNKVCVATCPSNMVGPGNGSCVLCGTGTYKDSNTGNCETSCTSGYYPDSVTQACLVCHTECLSCDGSYP